MGKIRVKQKVKYKIYDPFFLLVEKINFNFFLIFMNSLNKRKFENYINYKI
jgi:hypothetical protein